MCRSIAKPHIFLNKDYKGTQDLPRGIADPPYMFLKGSDRGSFFCCFLLSSAVFAAFVHRPVKSASGRTAGNLGFGNADSCRDGLRARRGENRRGGKRALRENRAGTGLQAYILKI